MNHTTPTAIEHLIRYLSGESGVDARRVIRTVRVSSARAKGRAKGYAYWGACRYHVRLTTDGWPVNVAIERAPSRRRSIRLAEQDAEATGRILLSRIGRLTEDDAQIVLSALNNTHCNDGRVHVPIQS